MPGLSPDPDKAARQLAGLATSNSKLAERLATNQPQPAAPAPPAPVAGPPATVAGLPVRHASHEEPPADDPPAPPELDEPEPGPDPDEPPADPEPEPDERGGWRGFLDGFAYG
jgi:hypothetical protein